MSRSDVAADDPANDFLADVIAEEPAVDEAGAPTPDVAPAEPSVTADAAVDGTGGAEVFATGEEQLPEEPPTPPRPSPIAAPPAPELFDPATGLRIGTAENLVEFANSDRDGDGIRDFEDPDLDEDGLVNPDDPDRDEDGIDDAVDLDVDEDGFLDSTEGPDPLPASLVEVTAPGSAAPPVESAVPAPAEPVVATADDLAAFAGSDLDRDRIPDFRDDDIDGDGTRNAQDDDDDQDGVADASDADVDGDGFRDDTEQAEVGDGTLRFTGATTDPPADATPAPAQAGSAGPRPPRPRRTEPVPAAEPPPPARRAFAEDLAEFAGSDLDDDGIPDFADPDIDGDGIGNRRDRDDDGDGIRDVDDEDVDGDGFLDRTERTRTDDTGLVFNGPSRGRPTAVEAAEEEDDGFGSGAAGLLDRAAEAARGVLAELGSQGPLVAATAATATAAINSDLDRDGIVDIDDRDLDGDGILNREDGDRDGDGVRDDRDLDVDGDGFFDSTEKDALLASIADDGE